MSDRKTLTKAIRFEVFKRDHFTCQYCGRKAPEAILEVDHIVPVAEGGTNDILNLVTSCRDCNRGKGKRKLDDNATVLKQRAELELMAERQEQVAMMVQWKNEMSAMDNMLIENLSDYWITITGYDTGETGIRMLRSCYNRFGYSEVYEAITIAVDKYFKDTAISAVDAFHKIGGICYNRKKQRENDAEQNY